MQIRAIIIEDEKSNRDNLYKILSDYCQQVKVVAQCASAIEGRQAITQYQPDLVFLDIEMPGGDGFSLLESIDNINFEVIFVTAFDHYGIKAVKFCALDYILKPIDILELNQAVDKVEKRLVNQMDSKRLRTLLENRRKNLSNSKIALPLADKIEFIEIENITRCKGEGNYTHIYTKTGESFMASKTLKEFEELLCEQNFLRTHQSHLINLSEVKSYVKKDGGYIKMKDSTAIAISRQRKEMVIEVLKSL